MTAEVRSPISKSLKKMNEDFKNGISNFFNSFGIQIKQQSDKPLQTLFLFENQKLKNTSLTEESLKQKEWYNYINETYLFLWDDLPSLNTQIDDDYKGILVFAVELTEIPKKTHLKEIARLISRNYYGLPVLVFFKYQDFLSIVNCERTNYKRKDLQNKIRIGKVYLLYNINLLNPHTGHIRILEKFYNDDIKNFKYAYDNLQKVFEIDILIDNFIKDITEWYFYALDEIEFPNDLNIDEQAFKQMTLLRMISRIIFIWYLKEMKLIPEELFDTDFLKNIVKDFGKKNHYYNAILQNLFFATLNRPIKERAFAKDEGFPKNKNNYGVYNLYRYEDLFLIPPEEVIELFSTIPFLNGGLFECLDKIDNDNKIIYIDGFSRNIKKRAKVPDHLFFDEYGLIPILKKYIFTIEENTPLDVEVALDPELIGKVFENLLAYYLPESSEAARKETGSYYTPKQIVEYMVNESLKERIKICYKEQYKKELPEEKIELLFDPSIEYEEQLFTDKEKENLIRIINQLKILDPAVGSGAFLQGALQKMVFLLQRLDLDNKLWKKVIKEDVINKQIKILKEDKERIQQLNDDEIKEKALKLVDKKLEEIEESFNKDYFFDDYARKLYLIEQCLYGVDIQPIAIQLSKLRFFLTLVIDQKVIEDPEQNYGIRPLPNLETKLIAANTLIPLKQDHQNSLKNLEILKLEEELKEIREKYFNAVNRQHKINAIQKDKEIREKIKTILLNDGWDTEIAQKIVEFDPYDQHNVASWFDPEWMFGITDGFDIVIGNPPNPPYISTKGVDSETKKLFKKHYGFSDDTYNHFFFKSFELLKDKGILAFITSKTFWTIQTKKKLRDLLLDNTILQIFDTGKPFKNAKVETCVIILKKEKLLSENTIIFFDGKKNIIHPEKYIIWQKDYINAPNKVIFIPNDFNKKIYDKFGKIVNELLNQWWEKISKSTNIKKHKEELDSYCKSLKPGDITLLGLITEGGQGLATGNNGKYIGVLEDTQRAKKIRKERPKKLLKAKEFCKKENIKTKADAQAFLNSLSEKEIRQLFDDLKEQYGRDVFGQGWLYRIVSPDEIADVDTLTDNEKLNGITGKKTFVPYDKGDKDGNRWYAPTPYYIDWSRENVKVLQTDPRARWQGYQFYFREGFCWKDIGMDTLKVKIKEKTINDVKSMALYLFDVSITKYIVSILNSTFFSNYQFIFVNNTVSIQINDVRQLPIIIPTPEQLKEFEKIFNRAVEVQKQKFAGKLSKEEAKHQLDIIQKELDKMVEEMYMS